MEVPAFVETFDPVYAGVILFTVLVVSEMVYARMTGGARFEAADSAASLAMGFGNLVSKLLFSGLLAVWFVFVYEHRLFDIGFAWWAWILASCWTISSITGPTVLPIPYAGSGPTMWFTTPPSTTI